MKCFSVNELDTFEFHDAYLSKIEIDNDNIELYLNGTCINTTNTQNKESFDTIADEIIFKFEKCEIISIIKINPDIISYLNNKKIISENKEYIKKEQYSMFFDMMKKGADLKYGGYEDDNYIFEMFDCENNLFDVTFKFEKVTAEWEYTSKKAWYVH